VLIPLLFSMAKGNNIFANLSSESYRRMIKFIEQAILATDLALFFVLVSTKFNQGLTIKEKRQNKQRQQYISIMEAN